MSSKKGIPTVIFRLYFVRHGETNYNKEHLLQGALDIQLNEKGFNQAKKAGVKLNTILFDKAYVSDLIRTQSTCSAILKENEKPNVNIIKDPRIRERNFGAVEGMNFADFLKILNEKSATFDSYTPKDGEHISKVQERIVQFFKCLCQSVYDKAKSSGNLIDGQSDDVTNCDPFQNILVVSHGAALKQLYTHFLNNLQCRGQISADNINVISANTAISEFLIKYSPRKYDLFCSRFCDAAHLEDDDE